jgi:hypothetical protein
LHIHTKLSLNKVVIVRVAILSVFLYIINIAEVDRLPYSYVLVKISFVFRFYNYNQVPVPEKSFHVLTSAAKSVVCLMGLISNDFEDFSFQARKV